MEFKTTTNTVCLNMIVKNESSIITRLFDSVLPIIDCYCICDTGSTDDTVQVITEYFNKKNITGKVFIEPFRNFSYNRNVALQKCLGMSDFVLLLDADMILKVNNFTKDMLFGYDNFKIFQGTESFHYKNMRIVANNGKYKYEGVTHECIDPPPNSKTLIFNKNAIFINDIGDGGSKSDKFERDIILLTEGIVNYPTNTRYHFYLAQSLHDIGRYEEAIVYYKKRIVFGGWKEEVWYSYYRIGLCFAKLNKMADAVEYWLEGYEYYPQRLEGLHQLLQHYRKNSKHKLGNIIYQTTKQILEQNNDRQNYLFLNNDVYTYKLHYEYTIIACYLGIKNINDQIIVVLNNSNDVNITNNLLQNMKFYKDILKPTQTFKFDAEDTLIVNEENVKFNSSSSCLIPNSTGPGYKMNVRFVNYFINEKGQYLNCDKHVMCLNKFVELDENFKIINQQSIEFKFNARKFTGVEDVRIFNDVQTNELMFTGTAYNKNNKPVVSYGKYDVKNLKLDENELSQTFNVSIFEKNWVFVDYKNTTHVVYDWHPLTICKIDAEKNELFVVENKETPKLFSNCRGSTCGFKYNNKIKYGLNENIASNMGESEIWFVNHIVSHENPRHYYHIISIFDENMNLLRYSAPFKFEGEPIEYCLSIVVEDGRVIINYSTWDRTTRIGIYDKTYIDSLVKYK